MVRFVFPCRMLSVTNHLVCIGLPAFKPGEKVEIDFGMDDL